MTVSPYIAIRNQLEPTANDALRKLIDSHIGETFPALAIAVISKGEVHLNASWGWVDPDTKDHPVHPGHLFDLASLTKLFVETAFLSFVSEGKIELDTPLVQIVPEFGEQSPRGIDGGQDPHTKQLLPTSAAFGNMKVDPADVTFYHLLTHTSGLAPWRAVYDASSPAPAPPEEDDPISGAERWRRALSALCSYPFVGLPGDTVRYSDLGLLLLGEAVSRLHDTSGKLDAAIKERVCEPLGLQSIIYNPIVHGLNTLQVIPTESDSTWRHRRCWGEVHDENACGVGGVAGHAGLFGNAGEVVTFGQAWLSHDARLGIEPDLMNNAIREHAHTGTQRHGLGWMLKSPVDSSAGDLFSAKSFGHTGFTGTSLWIDPERELVVACLTNRVYPGRDKPGIHPFRRTLHDLIAESF